MACLQGFYVSRLHMCALVPSDLATTRRPRRAGGPRPLPSRPTEGRRSPRSPDRAAPIHQPNRPPTTNRSRGATAEHPPHTSSIAMHPAPWRVRSPGRDAARRSLRAGRQSFRSSDTRRSRRQAPASGSPTGRVGSRRHRNRATTRRAHSSLLRLESSFQISAQTIAVSLDESRLRRQRHPDVGVPQDGGDLRR